MKRARCILIILLFPLLITAQSAEKRKFRIACYNVENYFDCVDDPLTNDSEYLPGGIRAWNIAKYRKKQTNIAKVIASIGEWIPPVLVGLCEIESDKCLTDLTRYSFLKNLHYKFLHHESPDSRGVDVALLYQPRQFKPIHDEAIRICFPQSPSAKTRDVLYAAGIIPGGDTLHVFVCHFPSRLGGELESEDRRMYVASVVRHRVDSLFLQNKNANIIVMGDLNDYPVNKSLLEGLMAHPVEEIISHQSLYNLMYKMHTEGKGSYKHDGEWGALDQILVSGTLLDITRNLTTTLADVHVYNPDFLLEDDAVHLGKQPFRTYAGMKYQDGYSDHLPVFVDFWIGDR